MVWLLCGLGGVPATRGTEKLESQSRSIAARDCFDGVRHVRIEGAPAPFACWVRSSVDFQAAVVACITKAQQECAYEVFPRGVTMSDEMVPGTVEVDLVGFNTYPRVWKKVLVP